MKTFLSFLFLSMFAVGLTGQAIPWKISGNRISPTAATNFAVLTNGAITLSGTTNRLTVAGGALLIDGVAIGGGGGGNTVTSGITYTGTATEPFIWKIVPSMAMQKGHTFYSTTNVASSMYELFNPVQNSLLTVDYGNIAGLLEGNGDAPFNSTSLLSLSMPKVQVIFTTYNPSFAALTNYSAPVLNMVMGNFAPKMDSLLSLSLPALTNVTGTFAPLFDSATNVTFSASLLSVGGDFSIISAALTQTSVNNILIRLAALDGTGGTTDYNNHTIDLSGGTSSTNSGAGLVAEATLIARTNVVILNP